MAPPAPFQVASLVNAPSFPNAVVWSDDNLIAVSTGDIVTILNPENPRSPRGVITLTSGEPFPIGVIDRADLLAGCLLPTYLSRDRQPCVRSLSWSPVGFSPNNGCLLAVCSTDGRVMVYRQPYREFQAEWVQIMDISDMLNGYFVKINYGEPEVSSSAASDASASQISAENYAGSGKTSMIFTKERKRKRGNDFNLGESSCSKTLNAPNIASLCGCNGVDTVVDSVVFSSSLIAEGSPVEVFKMDGGQHVWFAGRVLRVEGSMALVQFNETDANGGQQWFEMDSIVNTMNQFNHPGVPTVDGDYSFPIIRPSMDVARLPEQIVLVKHKKVGEFIKAGQMVEAWSIDRWLGGLFVAFADKDILVRFSGDADVVALNPSHVRLPPLWLKEEKSWKVTVVRVQMQELSEVVTITAKAEVNNSPQIFPAAKATTNLTKSVLKNGINILLTAHQYASRSSLLASLVVAWSPVLQLSATAPDDSHCSSCLLAVGTKSGTISIWRIHRPAQYSVGHQDDPKAMILVGVLHAHSTWVTSLSWGLLASDSSPQILLASGGCDGSAKIWLAHVCDFERSCEGNQTPFCLFCEVTAGDNAPVSALSLCVPVQSLQKILLAVGRGSGCLELWSCNRKSKRSKKVGSYHAHVRAVTGLAWAFDGRCLYSCSQDNSMHGWIHQKGSLSQVSIPSNNLGTRSSSDLPSVSDSCFGVAVSPGNLALAVARRFDAGQLDHMYQKRTQRAAVEFFWIGGQQVDIYLSINLEIEVDPCPGFSKDELACWGSKLLWSLNQYECHDKHLVIWDAVAASLAFKQCAPHFIKNITLRWLQLLLRGHLDSTTKDILSYLPRIMANISSRQLHLLNIFCRRVILSSGFKIVNVPAKTLNLVESYDMEEEQTWVDILSNIEKELRERLVGLSLSTVSVRMSHQAPKGKSVLWKPAGVAQMVKWVLMNNDHVHSQLNDLAPEVAGHAARLESVCEYMAEEHCCYCSAAVPFESPEMAFCEGVKCSDGEAAEKHKLVRCAVSMQVCPVTPLWFCMCCQRRTSNLPPNQLFTMLDYPSDFMSFIKPLVSNLLPHPLCPFCGISLQRLQPDFLLSLSPV